MGSSRVTSTRVDMVLEHIAAHTEDFTFSRGYSAHDDNENLSHLIKQALEAARKAEVGKHGVESMAVWHSSCCETFTKESAFARIFNS